MTDQFEISCREWIGDSVKDVEHAALAVLVVRSGPNKVFTRLEDVLAKTVREGPRISAYLLAEWLVANWWRILYEPLVESRREDSEWLMSHRVAAAGGGYLWPNLEFAGDGEVILVRSWPSRTEEHIRYLSDEAVLVARKDFEHSARVFVEGVLERLRVCGLGTGTLQESWKEVQREHDNAELSRLRRLEAMLGYDPGEAEELANDIRSADVTYGEGAVDEVAAGFKDASGDRLEKIPECRTSMAEVRVPRLEQLRTATSGQGKVRLAWERGEQAARAARRVWSIAAGPLDNRRLAELFGLPEKYLEHIEDEKNLPLATGLRNGDDGAIGVILKKRRKEQRRFMLARIVADHVAAGDKERLLPATEASTARQKFQRAFAHEFLCPYRELLDALDGKVEDEEAIEEVAERYQVSPLLVKTKLVNKGDLERESLEQSA